LDLKRDFFPFIGCQTGMGKSSFNYFTLQNLFIPMFLNKN